MRSVLFLLVANIPAHRGRNAGAEPWRTGAGVCVRLTAGDAGLHFPPLRTESLEFAFAEKHAHDPRVQALIRLLRTRRCRQLLSELPGYDARQTGEVFRT